MPFVGRLLDRYRSVQNHLRSLARSIDPQALQVNATGNPASRCVKTSSAVNLLFRVYGTSLVSGVLLTQAGKADRGRVTAAVPVKNLMKVVSASSLP